jgi:hypothetical protein
MTGASINEPSFFPFPKCAEREGRRFTLAGLRSG